MTEKSQNIILAQTEALLSRYCLENKGYTSRELRELLEMWRQDYSAKWIRLAVLEALYQGRYKVISIEQILSLWLRRGQATYHFTHEFEHLICRNLPDENVLSAELSELNTHYSPYSSSSEPELSVTVAKRHSSVNASPSTVTGEKLNSPESEKVNHAVSADFSDVKPQKSLLTDLKDLFAQFEGDIADLTLSSEKSTAPLLIPSTSSQDTNVNSGINQFTPLLDRSELYAKLKAVIKQELRINSQV
jgi:hypothetical protein